MAGIGNTSISGLLSAANSAARKQRDYDDQLAAFEWESSLKTSDDFSKYVKHLEGRFKEETDPSKALSYQRTIRSAQRAHFTEEIQRETINILEGNSSDANKYDRLVDLYYMAIDSGDLNLAQNLRLQIDNQQIKMETTAATAQSLASKLSDAQVDSIEALADKVLNSNEPGFFSIKNLTDGLAAGGEGYAAQVSEAIAQADPTKVGYFGALMLAAEQLEDAYIQGEELALAVGDTVKANEYRKEREKIRNGTMKFDVGGQKMSYNDFKNAQDAERNGQRMFNMVAKVINANGDTAFVLEDDQPQNGYRWVRDHTGEYRLIPTRGDKLSGNSIIRDGAKNDQYMGFDKDNNKSLTVDEYFEGLRMAGYDVRITEGGIFINSSGKTGRAIPGVTDGQQQQIFVDSMGRITFKSVDGKPYEIDPLSGQIKEFGTDSVSDFGDLISAPSQKGRDFVRELLSPDRGPTISQRIGQQAAGMDALLQRASTSGVAPTVQGTITNVLGVAAQNQRMIQRAEFLRKQQLLNDIPVQNMTTRGANINQMPVPQGMNAGLQVRPTVSQVQNLQVRTPSIKLPTVVVAPTRQQPNVVVNNTPRRQPSVVVAPTRRQPTVVVR